MGISGSGVSVTTMGGPERFGNITDGLSNTLLVGENTFRDVTRRATFWAYTYASYNQSSLWHAGWFTRGGKKRWAAWQAPAWWSAVWRPRNIATPANLLPPQAGDPNSVYIGVELLGDEQFVL